MMHDPKSTVLMRVDTLSFFMSLSTLAVFSGTGYSVVAGTCAGADGTDIVGTDVDMVFVVDCVEFDMLTGNTFLWVYGLKTDVAFQTHLHSL